MGIIVEWMKPADPGTEYIDDIDLDNLENCPAQMQTKFWSPDGDEFSIWEVEVWVERPTDGRIDLVVKYDQNLNLDNPKIRDLDKDYWGTNRIIIAQGKDHGNYHWTGNDGSTIEYEGTKYGWRKKELREPRNRRRSTQQIRDERFRPQIIARDQKCVITGETTKAALDAAHIIPAAKNGNEIPENGIVLRADIHRLYDAGMFIIHPETGKPVNINPELPETYTQLLEESEGLLPETLERVSAALWEIWPGDRSRV